MTTNHTHKSLTTQRLRPAPRVAMWAIAAAFAAGMPFDLGVTSKANAGFLKNLGKAVEKAVQDTGKTIEKAAHDTGKTAEKAAQDTGKTLEKAVHDTGKTVEKAVHDAGYAAEDAGQGVAHFIEEVAKQWAIFECRTLEGNNKTPDSPDDDKNKNNVSDKFEECMADGSSTIGVSGNSDGLNGFYVIYDGQQLDFNPDDWGYDNKTDEARQKESLAAFEDFQQFMSDVTSDQSISELSDLDAVNFEETWIAGIKTMLADVDPIGKSLENFYPPNETGLIRGPDGYASTGGSFLSLRSNGTKKYFHSGIDYVMNAGDPVKAGVSGRIIKVGCAYCGASKNPTDMYKTVWIRTDNGYVVRYLYVSPAITKGRVEKTDVIGVAQDLTKRYPVRANGKGIANHVHVQITDPDMKWVSPDGQFRSSNNKKIIEKAGDFFSEELLRIQGMLNHLRKSQEESS